MVKDQMVQEVLEKLESMISHPILDAQIPRPFINKDKICYLIRIFSEAGLSDEKTLELTSAIMTMQVALDTHDMVTNLGVDTHSLLSRQLIILAGDYYSGLYYKALATTENLFLLDKLSEGIKEINEWKIIAQYEDSPLEVKKEALIKIETLLLTKVCDMYENESIKKEIEKCFAGKN